MEILASARIVGLVPPRLTMKFKALSLLLSLVSAHSLLGLCPRGTILDP